MTPSIGERLISLAERVEKASGPDRELDALIRCAVFAPATAYVRQSPINGQWCIYEVGPSGKERSWEARGLTLEQRLGSFSSSLDAAMSLLTGCCTLVHLSEFGDDGIALARVGRPDLECAPIFSGVAAGVTTETPVVVQLSLALLAASLRAIASNQGDGR